MQQTQGNQFISEDVPFQFICPISQDIMEDPVLNKDSINFDRKFIEEWINRQSRDPISRKPLKKQDLIQNKALKNLIENFKKNRQKIKPQKKNLEIKKMFDFQIINDRNPQQKIDQKTIQSKQKQSRVSTEKRKPIKEQSYTNDQKCSCKII